jgi:hydroxyacylglutathione hydrolase
MTGAGTNTYILGSGSVALIDPGPDLPDHANAICASLEAGEKISHIFVTHSHLDHSPLAARLARQTGAMVHGFGNSTAGRSAFQIDLASRGLQGGGEGVDKAFQPDRLLADGDNVTGADWSLTALHTPGHMANHLCFAYDGVLFSGDHVMGWSTSLVSPPDGDMGAYMASLIRLQAQDWSAFHPGHGAPILDPAARMEELRLHRLSRETAIRAELARGPTHLSLLTSAIYTDIPPALLPAAQRNVLAHLLTLIERGEADAQPYIHETALFRLT